MKEGRDCREQVSTVAVQGDIGWRKLKERREEMKVVLDKRLEVLEEDRLVYCMWWKMN